MHAAKLGLHCECPGLQMWYAASRGAGGPHMREAMSTRFTCLPKQEADCKPDWPCAAETAGSTGSTPEGDSPEERLPGQQP